MGYWKQKALEEADEDDSVTLRCDRCGTEVPYHDAVVNGDVVDRAEAERIRERRDWVAALCSYCNHMLNKDD